MAIQHSVTLKRDQCKGCTNCIKHCPTEAIRVQRGKAKIIDERCVDCGECIRICPHHAKVAVTDPISSVSRFKYKIALPAPSLYGQFKNLSGIDKVLGALLSMGFDDVFEVARGADVVSEITRRYIREEKCKYPIISSACPAIVRLIRVRFPDLLDHILPVLSPMEVAATMAKDAFCQRNGVAREDVGAFFITPCAAKVTAIRSPLGRAASDVDGAISMLEVYGLMMGLINKPLQEIRHPMASGLGVGWANAGGESLALYSDNLLAVDGIINVIRALEEIENGKLNDLQFFEGNACVGGCVGGPLTFENGFVAKTRMRRLIEKASADPRATPIDLNQIDCAQFLFDKKIEPNEAMQLDKDIVIAMQKMERMEKIAGQLPGLDCGSCGSPTCRSLAEDIVRGFASEMDCIFKLKEKVGHLAQEMVELSRQANQLTDTDKEDGWK